MTNPDTVVRVGADDAVLDAPVLRLPVRTFNVNTVTGIGTLIPAVDQLHPPHMQRRRALADAVTKELSAPWFTRLPIFATTPGLAQPRRALRTRALRP